MGESSRDGRIRSAPQTLLIVETPRWRRQGEGDLGEGAVGGDALGFGPVADAADGVEGVEVLPRDGDSASDGAFEVFSAQEGGQKTSDRSHEGQRGA